MKRSILSIFMIFIVFKSFAQIEIAGKIIDINSKSPIEYAEIILLNNESKIISGVVTTKDGTFNLNAKKGVYIMLVSYIGNDLYRKEISLNENINLGVITVENSINLEETIITAKKKLIERKIDRLVFNVENSTKSSQGDALEVLKVTPGVRVRNDRISMIGKSNLQVMVNDKILRISGDDLVNFLSSIASEDIKNIEVITSPPAKYDAQGNSGLININTKKAKENSWNAQLRSYYRQRSYPLGSLGGSFNYKKNKFSIASSVNYRNGNYFQEQEDYTYFPDGIWHLSSPYKAVYDGLNARIDLNYNITSKWSMGIQYLNSKTDAIYEDHPLTEVTDTETNNLLSSLKSTGEILPNSTMNAFNYNNVIVLDAKKRKLFFDLDYFDFKNDEESSYEGNRIITETNSEQFYRGLNNNNQKINNLSIKLDIDYPTKFAKMNFGGKFSKTKSLNDIGFFNSGLVDQPIQNFNLAQNDFEYKEDVQALYFSIKKKVKKIGVKLGVRMEATKTNSISTNLNFNVKDDYVKFFPTVYIAYFATDNSTFAFTYNKRIQRPSFIQLNPNSIFINPFQTIEGNAFLKPAFIDNIELTNSYKNFESKIYYSNEKNMFSQVPLADTSTNFIRFTNQNFIDRYRFGFSENYTYDKVSWWSSNNSFDLNYSVSTFNLEQEEKDQKGVNATISTDNDFILNEDKTLVAGLNFWYEFPGVNGVFDKKSASSLSLSLRYLLLNKNLNITVRANDIFKDTAERTEATVNGVFQTAYYYYDNQSFQLSVSYKFGNKKIRAKRHRTGNRGERRRTQ